MAPPGLGGPVASLAATLAGRVLRPFFADGAFMPTSVRPVLHLLLAWLALLLCPLLLTGFGVSWARGAVAGGVAFAAGMYWRARSLVFVPPLLMFLWLLAALFDPRAARSARPGCWRRSARSASRSRSVAPSSRTAASFSTRCDARRVTGAGRGDGARDLRAARRGGRTSRSLGDLALLPRCRRALRGGVATVRAVRLRHRRRRHQRGLRHAADAGGAGSMRSRPSSRSHPSPSRSGTGSTRTASACSRWLAQASRARSSGSFSALCSALASASCSGIWATPRSRQAASWPFRCCCWVPGSWPAPTAGSPARFSSH